MTTELTTDQYPDQTMGRKQDEIVRLRIGDRREYIIGHVATDHRGRVDFRQVAALLIATGDHIHTLIHDSETREDTP